MIVTIAKFFFILDPYLRHKMLKAPTPASRMVALRDHGQTSDWQQ